MSPEAQRIAIAGALGLELLNQPSPIGTIMARRKGTDWFVQRDWLNDLNAMHKAEEVLDPEDWIDYVIRLSGRDEGAARERPTYWEFDDLRTITSATAAQRAEAFLRTLGLWTE